MNTNPNQPASQPEKLTAQPIKFSTLPAFEHPTLRDQFAMAALTGLLAGLPCEMNEIYEDVIAQASYKIGDAMLEARKK